MTAATIQSLSHFPIKGLRGHRLSQVTLKPNEGFPFDRAFGFARHDTGFDPDNPTPLPARSFHILSRDPRLGALKSSYVTDTQILTLDDGTAKVTFDLSDATQRNAAAAYVQRFLDLSDAQAPNMLAASPIRFTDYATTSTQMMNAVSLINQASVDALSEKAGQPVGVERFRGNIVFDGLPAFSELDLVGETITIGAVTLRVIMQTKRCAATEVNIATGECDIKVPYLLRKNFGHLNMGVYAEVVTGGTLRPGDPLTL